MKNLEKPQIELEQKEAEINKFGDSQKRVELTTEGMSEARTGDPTKAAEIFKTIISEINEGRLSDDPFKMYEAAEWLIELDDTRGAIDGFHKTLEKNGIMIKIGEITNPLIIEEHKEFNEKMCKEALLEIYGKKIPVEDFNEEDLQEFEQLISDHRNQLAKKLEELLREEKAAQDSTRKQWIQQRKSALNEQEYEVSEMMKKLNAVKKELQL